MPSRVTQQWIETNGPRLDGTQRRQLIAILRSRNWTDAELHERVYPQLR
jgi:hypothetical protein